MVFVHEGVHAYESYKKIPQSEISSRKGERRAYWHEHEFQVKKGEYVEYKDYGEICVHVNLNYDP